MNIMLVIVALLFNLLTGNGTANISNTTSVDSSAWANPNYLVQLMYMYGGNVDMTRPMSLKMGIRHTGGAKARPFVFMVT